MSGTYKGMLQKGAVMVNLLCHLEWAVGWSGLGLYIIFSESTD